MMPKAKCCLLSLLCVGLFLAHSSTCFVPISLQRSTRSISTWLPLSSSTKIEQGSTAADESPAVPEAMAAPSRGKVNEIDFCIAPADVSLSRSYAKSASAMLVTSATEDASPVLSLTRALNNASNRAVRRILLARAWPSAEALNKSFRQAALAEKEREAAMAAQEKQEGGGSKCPIPRPILNLLVRRRADKKYTGNTNEKAATSGTGGGAPSPRSRTDEEYVTDQLNAFRERYGNLPGYMFAEAYLESILSLATSGKESPRVKEVMESGIYDESYRRIVGVLRTVGASFEGKPFTGNSKIAPILKNQDISLSMLDKISLKKEASRNSQQQTGDNSSSSNKASKKDNADDDIKSDDLGGLLLSAKEPTMTRELNALSNIVQRALLFGGDQELLVLFETLVADRPRFVQRWYPNTGGVDDEAELDDEERPGMQFFNSLLKLLSECYNYGVVTTLDPPFALIESYANAYERLMATLVELGSGYVKPTPGDVLSMPIPRTAQEELGRFAVWESTFRQNSGAGSDISSYPEDLAGNWEVQDLIGSEIIGVSTVEFQAQGTVEVAPPLEGLRWRLDPGPTHLDTVTFQVLSDDKTILQYRGFVDRGARLESRFSKRPIKIRGSVEFQMRDTDVVILGEDYWKDMLPFNYRTGTTKFVMTKMP
ncbi:expressed unknown protein [Seminavis robusta]|uniref:Uncharacterized protein n=1 Tax=Seminavis robusta TaxID=568900 RepID=A0A9N8ED99_9STRA|nr:expressed unknown protein [Seminavis robusta]|eukprot:Sro922_g220490.1 n/a (656) ;mRNA; r:8705-10764